VTATGGPLSTTARRLPREQRREAIVDSAASAFSQSGYADTSMDDIAAAAGVTKLILYRHFPSKEDLYREVVGNVATRIGGALAAGRDRGEFYGLHARAILSVARADPDGFRLLWQHTAREEAFAQDVSMLRREAVRYATPRIAALVDDPGIQAWAAETVVAFLISSVLNWLDTGDPDRDEDFLLVTTRSLKALVGAWSGNEAILARVLDVEIAPAGVRQRTSEQPKEVTA
jgi:AcrR family transcriptional regulator